MDAIVLRAFRFGLWGRLPAEAQSLRLSAAVAAALGSVPRGQWALLDAYMLVFIDRSACLVEPSVLVELLSLLPVLVQAALGTSSAASGRCSRMPIARSY